jgi:hypothetical protein
MRLRLVLIATLLLTTAAAKYEDSFGKVFDWKRPGQSRLVDSIVGTDSTLLLVEDGIIVKDGLGTLC